MHRYLALLSLVPLLACSSPERLATDACGDPGPRGDTRAQLRVLGCMTAVTSMADSERRKLGPQVERAFREAYEDLLRKPMLEETLGEWAELYRLSARYYPRTETLAGSDGTPIAFVNAHHYSVPFWVRRSLEMPLGTLVHFDTHSDMEAVPRMDDVRGAVERIRAGRDARRGWHILAHAVYRNSMPVSAAVLAAGVNEVVWAKPTWTRDPVDFFSRNFFYGRAKGMADPRPLESFEAMGPDAFAAAFSTQTTDFFQLYYDPEANEGSWLPRREMETETWVLVGPNERPHEKSFEGLNRIRFSVLTTDQDGESLRQLPRAVSGDRFVLDIDLDYFVNQGSEVVPSDDFPSYGQRALRRDDIPDSTSAIFAAHRLHAAGVAAERGVIDRRIRQFRSVLQALRDAGKRPSIVSIADSANLPFTSYREGQERAEFVPLHHAYRVHERVVSVIKEIFGGGPTAYPDTPAEAPRAPAPSRPEPTFGPDSPVATLVMKPVGNALLAAVTWATGAASTYGKTPQLSGYLLILHAVATHGPSAWLRRIAAEAAALHATSLDSTTLGPPFTPSGHEVEESLRRILFAKRYGNRDADLTLAAARWAARAVSLAAEPDIDRAVEPLKPSQALEVLGVRRWFTSGEEANLADFFVFQQTTDGGFGSSDLPSFDRALLNLLAVRALLGLLPTAPLDPEPKEPLWKNCPLTQADVDRAVLRGILFSLAHLGELPTTDEATDGLLLLRTLARVSGNPAARHLTKTAGKLLASRTAVKIDQMVGGADDPSQLVALAELGLALAEFGVDVRSLRAQISARLARHSPERVLSTTSDPPTFAEVYTSLSRSQTLEEFGIHGFSYEQALRQALPVTAAATFVPDGPLLVERFNAISHLLLSASGSRRVLLDRQSYPGEWRFLESVFVEVMASRRPDMVSALLESMRILGEPTSAPRMRDLVWQLLHDQARDGSWGRSEPQDQRLRQTWAAVSALAELERGEPTRVTQSALALTRNRPPPAAGVAAATPAERYKPGALLEDPRTPKKTRKTGAGLLRTQRR
jgi:hypothetical protein